MWSRLFMRTGLTFAPRSTMEYFGSTFCVAVNSTCFAAGMERPPAAGPAHAANAAQQTTIETRCVMYPPNVERRLASRRQNKGAGASVPTLQMKEPRVGV